MNVINFTQSLKVKKITRKFLTEARENELQLFTDRRKSRCKENLFFYSGFVKTWLK